MSLLTAPAVLFARHDYVESERVMLFTATVATAAFILTRFAEHTVAEPAELFEVSRRPCTESSNAPASRQPQRMRHDPGNHVRHPA